ncbi:MAG: imidazole glycerol phosphate synthase subunit HisH [Patescibacteria group bacterium]|jgi:glutamine amidotransferase
MKNPTIAIVDYGVGNLYNLQRALRVFTPNVVVTEEADVIAAADAIVLPGVGAFASGMRGLELRGLLPVIKEAAAKGTPMLGICLGAQLFLSEGQEFGVHQGLGLIPGTVVPLAVQNPGTKIPHIGWNGLVASGKSPDALQNSILHSMKPQDQVYFVHSFVMEPRDAAHCLTNTEYGGTSFCSVIRSGNIYGCQFHPEKSGAVGLGILGNFVEIVAESA